MHHRSSQLSIWDSIWVPAFLSGQQLSQWKAAGATITGVILLTCGFHHTHLRMTIIRTQAGPTQELQDAQLSQASDNLAFKIYQWPHANIFFKGIQLSQFGQVFRGSQMYLCAWCEGYYAGKLQALIAKPEMLEYSEENPSRIYCKQVHFSSLFLKILKVTVFFSRRVKELAWKL